MRKVLIAVVGAGLLALPGCGNESSAGGSLTGKTYLSTAVVENGEPKQLAGKIRLQFTEDGRLIADAGCNQLQAPVETGAGKIAVKDLSMTNMGCDQARHATDEWLAKLLQAGPTWKLTADKLAVSTDTTTIDLTDRETAEPDLPLEGTKWRLSTVLAGDTASHQAGSEQAYLTINGERVTGSTGCNEFQGKVARAGDKLTFGELATTRRACAGDAGKLEQSLLGVLTGEVGYQIESNQLRLRPTTPAGTGLDFTGTR